MITGPSRGSKENALGTNKERMGRWTYKPLMKECNEFLILNQSPQCLQNAKIKYFQSALGGFL